MSYDLKELVKGSIFTGMLSELHEDNLKIYPFIFLDGVNEAEINYDLGIENANIEGVKPKIIYTIKFNEGFPIVDRLNEQVENLRKAVSILFQCNTNVKVFNQQGIELGVKID